MRIYSKLTAIALCISTLSLFSLTTYANQGQGGGGGHGQAGKASHGQAGKASHGQANKASHGQANKASHGKAGVNKAEKGVKATSTKASNKTARFTQDDKSTITNYVNKNALPPTALPPGIAMNVARGKPLPPGIAKQYLPNDLVNKLPAYPGYAYQVVGNDVVLVDKSTGIVADIISNVLK